MSTRRGFSLAELMVAMVVAGIIGIALTRLVVSQSRFVALQDGLMRARAGARAGFNVALAELRTVTHGGLIRAKPDTVEARVPLAFGVSCGQPSGGQQAILLMPHDSAALASATVDGYAWRDASGEWQFTSPATITSMGASSAYCTSTSYANPAIARPSGWQIITISPNNIALAPGNTVYLYQTVRYRLGPSAQLSGRRALWRLADGTEEELAVPFDTTSRFSFLVGNRLTPQASAPASLDSVRGLRLTLVGQSEEKPEGRSSPASFTMLTDIVFVNRVTR